MHFSLFFYCIPIMLILAAEVTLTEIAQTTHTIMSRPLFTIVSHWGAIMFSTAQINGYLCEYLLINVRTIIMDESSNVWYQSDITKYKIIEAMIFVPNPTIMVNLRYSNFSKFQPLPIGRQGTPGATSIIGWKYTTGTAFYDTHIAYTALSTQVLKKKKSKNNLEILVFFKVILLFTGLKK